MGGYQVNRKDKERVQVEVVQRVLDEVGTDAQRVEQAVFDTLYEERKRLETEPDGPSKSEQLAFYERMHTRSLRMDVQSQRKALKQITHRFVQEVTGHFDPRVYALSTRLVPVGLNLLLNALSPIKLVQSIPLGMSDLKGNLKFRATYQRVKSRTKSNVGHGPHPFRSNSGLDSDGICHSGAWAFPRICDGAGLNLFSKQADGFFMHNLGAYRGRFAGKPNNLQGCA